MSRAMCPGQDTRFWKPCDVFEVICSRCGYSVEFFRDDAARRCTKCGQRVQNPKLSLGCAQWCEHARECLGFDPKAVHPVNAEEVSLADRIIETMKSVFGDDQKRITHALQVFEYAQEILRKDGADDPKVVIAAAILHDIGIQEAERKYNSNAGNYQEMEGPPIARKILEDMDFEEPVIEHVCRIIANHHSAKDIDTREFRIIWDADWLVNLGDDFKDWDKEKKKGVIDKVFKTKSGKEKAYKLFVN